MEQMGIASQGRRSFSSPELPIRINLPPSPTATLFMRRRTIASIRTSLHSAASSMRLNAARRSRAGRLPSTISRGNYSYTLQISGDIRNRFYYNLGSGIENNGLFGLAGTPRASVAYYLVRPSASWILSGTKLHASFGKGIKEPNVFQQGSSLFDILSQVAGRQRTDCSVSCRTDRSGELPHLRWRRRPGAVERPRAAGPDLLPQRVYEWY